MALPKKRHSKARGRRRRTFWKLKSMNLVACPHCKSLKFIHHICNTCGYYDGKQVIKIKEKKKQKKA